MRTHAETLFQHSLSTVDRSVAQNSPEEILRTDISDLKPLPKWSSGRIGLIGDAAHATTPNLGQGGAMAVEDALALADSFVQAGLNESAWKISNNGGAKKSTGQYRLPGASEKSARLEIDSFACPQPGFEEDSGERVAKTSSANV